MEKYIVIVYDKGEVEIEEFDSYDAAKSYFDNEQYAWKLTKLIEDKED